MNIPCRLAILCLSLLVCRASAQLITLDPDAYAIAYTLPGSTAFGRLDHLVFQMPVAVPEPSFLALAGLGLAAGLWRLRRRNSGQPAQPVQPANSWSARSAK